MKIKIVTVGKVKQKELILLTEQYLKQMKNVSVIEVDDEKNETGLDKEAKSILSKISSDDYVIVLAIEGKSMDSVEFSETLDKIVTFHTPNIVFIIGGSYGLAPDVKTRANLMLSFSKMTFPHQLMRLILIEQIYRAQTILKNHPYHK